MAENRRGSGDIAEEIRGSVCMGKKFTEAVIEARRFGSNVCMCAVMKL